MDQWRTLYVSVLLHFSFISVVIGEPCLDCNSNSDSLLREKRIIYGSPLYNLNAYDVGWFVRISLASSSYFHWNQFVNKKIVSDVSPSPGSHLCGGSLLTPRIVQTACHCLTNKWSPTPPWSPKYNFPLLFNGWENLLVLHHGFTRVKDMENGVWSKKFVVHAECKIMNETFGQLSHDFGMILTAKALPELDSLLNNFAPVYTIKDLALQFWKTLKHEAVCLQIGFGIYYFANLTQGIYGDPSPVLMHGWRRIQSYWRCYLEQMVVVSPLYGQKEIFGEDYLRDCTWACTSFFGKQRGIEGPGDSGSPVICIGQYFAIMTSVHGKYGFNIDYSKEMISALAFNMFDNAANYRTQMVEQLHALANSKADNFPGKDYSTIDPLDPRAFYSTWNPNDFDY